MGKVVTSEGLVAFVTEGKSTHVENHKASKPGEAPPLEVKADAKTTELGDGKQTPDVARSGAAAKDGAAEGNAQPESDSNEGLDPEDKDLSETVRRKIGKKHRAMMEARELAAENERLAETLYNQRALADKRAEEAERRLAQLEAQKQPPKAAEPELKQPTPDDKDAEGKFLYRDANGQLDWDKYTDAKVEFKAEEAVKKERQRQADEKQAAMQAERQKALIKSVDDTRKRHPDFDEVLSSIKGTPADQVPQYVLDYMHEDAEFAGELAYYFAKNPEERDRISNMTARLGTAEIGRLRDKLMSPPKADPKPTATVTSITRPERGGAPAPITPLNGEGTSGVVTDPAKMNFQQLRAYERERARKRH
ncbi:MAG TPA: hypothetical protein VGG80_07555 [Acidobacteriaceae bacterium]